MCALAEAWRLYARVTLDGAGSVVALPFFGIHVRVTVIVPLLVVSDAVRTPVDPWAAFVALIVVVFPPVSDVPPESELKLPCGVATAPEVTPLVWLFEYVELPE